MSSDSRIEFDVDVNAVRNSLKRLAPEAEKEIRSVVKKSTIQARGLVKARAPQRSGLLEKSIRSKTSFTKDKTRGMVTVIGPARKYAWIVEHGSKRGNVFEGRKYIASARHMVVPEFKRNMEKAVHSAIQKVGLDD